MNISQPISSTVQSISFSFLTSEDVRRISVKQIVNPVLLDDLNRPNVGGLYDPALGPSDRKDLCSTCHLTYFTCPGHYGHIELPVPIFHPLFFQSMHKVMKGMCTYCHRFKMHRNRILRYTAKLRLLDFGLLDAADSVDNMTMPSNMDGDKDDEEETVEAESLQNLERRLNAFVVISIARCPNASRDSYKQGMVYQARKALITEFLSETTAKKCYNEDCLAFSHSLRAEAHSKIVELDLTPKQKMQHDLIGRKREDVLDSDHAIREGAKPRDNSVVETAEPEGSASESEVVSELTFSDEDDELAKKTTQLPKSVSGKVKTARGRNERIIPPEECRAHLRRLFANEKIMCALIFGRHGKLAPVTKHKLSWASADMFFLDCLLVSPTRFRPPAKMKDTIFEHPHNELLSKLLTTTYRIRDQSYAAKKAAAKDSAVGDATRRRMIEVLLESLVQLQVDVNSFMDSSKNPTRPRQGKLPTQGVKQNLEKKEGLFRMHMMGKRVNYAARSVISPDVNIEPNEIGVPPIFANKLYIPEPVTERNVHRLRELVIRGAHKYPGASFVEFEDGTKRSLEAMPEETRRGIANQLLTPPNDLRSELSTKTPAINKKVYRHLRDGDMLILNRQPTLHKPSMMAHKAKVLQGEKTIRMHYANCNSYNADFDGDEMNIHFPQSEIARSEAMFIANTNNQYLVPTSGKPLRGLIQDHVVAGVWMTNRDTFFTRDEYFQLLYGSLRPEDSDQPGGRLQTLPPTIWKPKPLWTGKQIISTVLLNITPEAANGLSLTSKTKVPGKLWGPNSEEGLVIFKRGELLCGVMDKSQFGATDYGLVHSVYELYGADIAGKLLGILSRLFTKYLQHRAFTCRMDDLTLTEDGDSCRRGILEKGKNLGTEGAIDNFPSLASTPSSERHAALRGFLRDVLRDDSKMAGLDVSVKKKLSKLTESIASACMPDGLQRKFPYNHMQMMTQSGAKGSAVNAQQISCLLGQQELEGRRVPVMVSGKTLPSFKAFETAAIAGGYVASRFLTGVKPQEFYFHCMAGREGLIDTAVKTSRSGYLQRCLIKHLEGILIHYDNTVRGSDASVYQFHYGGDSLDVTKQKHLYQFEFLATNMFSLLARYRLDELIGHVEDGEAASHMKKVLKRLRKVGEGGVPTPTLSLYNPSRHLGSTSEKFAQKVDDYIKKNPDYLLRSKGDGNDPLWLSSCHDLIHDKKFKLLMQIKYMRSLIEPGEAVGLLASQGVGEPSTQMTLNTFHFAGHGAANVTLGIPRLREIVMTASTKPKTPSMTLAVGADVTDQDAQAFCRQATRLTLSEIVENVEVNEQLLASRRRRYTINIHFYPKDEYREEHDVEPPEVLASFAVKFPQIFKKEITQELKKLNADLKTLASIGKGQSVSQSGNTEEDADEEAHDDGVDDASETGDGDADHEKRNRQTNEVTTYDTDEEDEALQGEYDEAAIEAEFAEPSAEKNANSEDASLVTADEALGLKGQITGVRTKFCENLKVATNFDFSDNGVQFDLEFDSESPKLLLVDIPEKTCQRTVIREIPGISDCFLSKETIKGEEFRKLVTNGSNIRGLWFFANAFEIPVLEEIKIITNDIHAALMSYGVEMARALILKEVQGVFGAYNIDVDIRHLELIADYMTYDGGYKPFNRKGISTNSSPLLKASFETTAAFLSDATLHGDFDDLSTPSGSIVLGRPNKTGTGVFDIRHGLLQ